MTKVLIDTHFALSKEMKSQQKKVEQPYHTMRIEARFGHNVRMYRIQRQLTQAQLADVCDLNQNYVSEIECGKRNVTLRVVESISKALGVEVKDLIS